MKREDLIRNQFEGFSFEIYEWECLTPTVFLNEKFKEKTSETEIILAYLRASEILLNGLLLDNNPVYHIKVIRRNQICMPFIYLCRHALELALKLRIQSETNKTVSGHKLSKLYDILINCCSELKNDNELFVLVSVLNEIDDDGCKLRYSKDKSNKLYQNKPVFVKVDKIFDLTKKICENIIKSIP